GGGGYYGGGGGSSACAKAGGGGGGGRKRVVEGRSVEVGCRGSVTQKQMRYGGAQATRQTFAYSGAEKWVKGGVGVSSVHCGAGGAAGEAGEQSSAGNGGGGPGTQSSGGAGGTGIACYVGSAGQYGVGASAPYRGVLGGGGGGGYYGGGGGSSACDEAGGGGGGGSSLVPAGGNVVLASPGTAPQVQISYGEAPRNAPTVSTAAASSVAQASAILNATVNPEGCDVTDCHFD